MNAYSLARNLAVCSHGLGFAELLAPRKVARMIGVSSDHEKTLQMLGLREIASGLGIMQGKPAYFLWSRVAGDIMDLSLLGAAMRSGRNNQRRLQCAIATVVGVTVLDILASVLHSREYAEPGWRDRRPMSSRGAIERGDPVALRENADQVMRDYGSRDITAEYRDEGQVPMPRGASCDVPHATGEKTSAPGGSTAP
jgi:hypothetical protein